MVDGKMNCVKYLMFFFNFLFWLSGLILIIIGAIIRDKYGDTFNLVDSKFGSAPVLIIVVGAIVFVVGFLGCCGAVKENYCMVTTFAVLLVLIFILEIVAGVIGFVYKEKVNDYATDALKKAIASYGTDEGVGKLMDLVQPEFKCCGVSGAADYNSTKGADVCTKDQGGVKSCHEGKDCTKTLFSKGCKETLINYIKSNMVLVGGVALGIAFIQLLGIVFACLLMRAIKGEYEVV